MAVTLWGLLKKSTTDSETIEDAVGRLIAEHEADPTAHLGTGESLAAHKSAEVIDHPAESVLADKLNSLETVINGPWPPVASLLPGSNCENVFPGMSFAADWEGGNTVGGGFFVSAKSGRSFSEYEIISRQNVGFEQYGTGNFFQVGMFHADWFQSETKEVEGLYFSVEDGNIYAKAKYEAWTESEFVKVADEIQDLQVWEIAIEPVAKIAKFKIDGQVVVTIDTTGHEIFLNGIYMGARAYAPSEANQIIGGSASLFLNLRLP